MNTQPAPPTGVDSTDNDPKRQPPRACVESSWLEKGIAAPFPLPNPKYDSKLLETARQSLLEKEIATPESCSMSNPKYDTHLRSAGLQSVETDQAVITSVLVRDLRSAQLQVRHLLLASSVTREEFYQREQERENSVRISCTFF